MSQQVDDAEGRLTNATNEHPQIPDTEAHLRELTPRQRKYVEAIVHMQASVKEAAAFAKMSEQWCRTLRHEPRVNRAIEIETIVHYRGLRREIVRNLKDLMEHGENEVARVNAARVLDTIVKPAETEVARSVQQPGYVLLIPGAVAPTIEHEFPGFPPIPPRLETGHAAARQARWAHKQKLVPPTPEFTKWRKAVNSATGQRPEMRELRRINARDMWAKRKAAAAAKAASSDRQSGDQDG